MSNIQRNLIVFEGIDDAGKSTMLRNFKDYLISKKHHSVISYKFPSEGEHGKAIYRILKDPNLNPLQSYNNCYDFIKHQILDKYEIYSDIIRSLDDYDFVLIDRFLLSNIAYDYADFYYYSVLRCLWIEIHNSNPPIEIKVPHKLEICHTMESLQEFYKSIAGDDTEYKAIWQKLEKMIMRSHPLTQYVYFTDIPKTSEFLHNVKLKNKDKDNYEKNQIYQQIVRDSFSSLIRGFGNIGCDPEDTIPYICNTGSTQPKINFFSYDDLAKRNIDINSVRKYMPRTETLNVTDILRISNTVFERTLRLFNSYCCEELYKSINK
jgi:hypothetical protein